MEERDIYEKINPEVVESILEASELEKIPRSIKGEKVKEEEKPLTQNSQREGDIQQEVKNNVLTIQQGEPKSGNDVLKNAKGFFPRPFKKGDIISVTVVKIQPNGVMVSAGSKEDHFIPIHGLSLNPISSPEEVVKIGNKIDVLVMRDGNNGGVVLSKKMADYVKKWQELKEKFKKNEVVSGKVVKSIKGGLLVDINGIGAFLPQSQIGLRKGETVDSFVGKTLDFHILELDQTIRRIIISRLKVLSELKEKERMKYLVNLKKGEIYTGVVRSIQDFGIFVDIGNGIDGLVRVNELTWGRRKPAQEVVHIGETIKVKVIGVNLESGKVALSLRQSKPYPWDVVDVKFPVGSIVEGTVIRIHPFGAVVELEDGITGLVHISQLDIKRINKVEDVVKVGEKIQVKVTAIDRDAKKIKLSRRAILEEGQEES